MKVLQNITILKGGKDFLILGEQNRINFSDLVEKVAVLKVTVGRITEKFIINSRTKDSMKELESNAGYFIPDNTEYGAVLYHDMLIITDKEVIEENKDNLYALL